MSQEQWLLSLAILLPVVGSLVLLLVGGLSASLRNVLALVFVLGACVCSALLLPAVLGGEVIRIRIPMSGLDMSLTADRLAVFMAMVSSFISAVILVYSMDYIKPYANSNEYFVMVVLFLGAMMGLVYSSNLILLYVFWEITAITSWRLIGFFREDYQVRRANKAFLVTVFGALAMLLGFVVLWEQFGTLEISEIGRKLGGSPVPALATLLIMMGILSKSATLPFHTWLPDAGVAPSPVTSLLHAAVLVKIGVYVFARLFVASWTLDPHWQSGLMALAALSALVSACGALVEHDLKRIIAYSTVSQLAFIFLGLLSGTEIGIAGALLYILMHGLAKGGLFLCAGIVEQKTHTKDLRHLGGLAKTMPWTAAAFLVCSLSVMGIPPFGGFFSKFMVISGAARSPLSVCGMSGTWVAAVFLFGAVLTILYLIRAFNRVFMGEYRGHHEMPREGSPVMVGSVVMLAALGLLAGIFIWPSAQLAAQATTQMRASQHAAVLPVTAVIDQEKTDVSVSAAGVVK